MSGMRADKGRAMSIVVIDSRALERECFARGIEAARPKTRVASFASVAEWIAAMGAVEAPDTVLYNAQGRRMSEPRVGSDIGELLASGPSPVVVLSPYEDLSEMVAAIDLGARGYIPASLGIEATLLAVQLAGVATICMPATSLAAIREVVANRPVPEGVASFTCRQAAVAEGLRRGKPNKLIAYDLNMCESTVKVHIRNIMKKLQARNRTEAGYKLSQLLPGSEAPHRLLAALSGSTVLGRPN